MTNNESPRYDLTITVQTADGNHGYAYPNLTVSEKNAKIAEHRGSAPQGSTVLVRENKHR